MSAPSFSRTAIKLHSLLWRRSLQKNPSAIFMQVFIVFFGLMGLFSTAIMMAFGITTGSYTAFGGAVCVGVTAYIIAAIMLPSGEGQISPESFVTLPVTAKEVLPSLVLVQLLQTRGVLALICTLVTTVVSSVSFAAAGVGVVGVVLVIVANILSLITTIVMAEALALLLNSTTDSAKKKNSRAVFSLLAYMVGCIGFVLLFNNIGTDPETQLSQLGNIAQWTPVAAATGIATCAITGNWLGVFICTVITAVTLAGGVAIWWNAVNKRLSAPLDNQSGGKTSSRRRQATGSILLPWLPYNPRSAVFSRALYYALRDSRTLTTIIMIPFMAIYFIVMTRTIGPQMILVAIPLLVVIGTSSATNDYGQDGPSNWLHMVSGIRSADLVLGRHWGAAALPLLLVWVVNLGIVIYQPKLPTVIVILLSIGLQFSCLAIAVLLSVFNPFPTAKPGTNPWQDKSGYSAAAFIAVFSGMFLGWIPVAPGGVMVVLGLSSGNTVLTVLGLVVAILLPVLGYYFALRSAVKRVEQHYPEIFAKVRSFVS